MQKYVVLVIMIVALLLSAGVASAEPAPTSIQTTIAVMPVIDKSNVKYGRDMVDLVDKFLGEQLPPGQYKVITGDAVTKAAQKSMVDLDNPERSDFVTIGKALNVDQLLFIQIEPIKFEGKGGGFIAVGHGTLYATVGLKVRLVDVKNDKYLYNKTVKSTDQRSSAVVGPFGGVSPKNTAIGAAKKALEALDAEFPPALESPSASQAAKE